MTRDYAKKSTKRSPQRSSSRGNVKRRPKKHNQSPPDWLWLFAGVLIGVLIMSLTKLSEVPSDQESDISEDTSTENSDNSGNKPRFDFYTLLRESEVIVPDTPDTDNTATQSVNSNDTFLLQVGSFKSNSDADSLRARLLLLNLNAKIEKVSPRKNETWHRVIVGPFSDRSELANARGKLASNGIDSLLLKRKK
jgi:cell division protein FtsN